MAHVITELALSGIIASHLRAEDAGRDSAHRDGYDIAVSRAVAGLVVLCEFCLPLVKPGGLFLAMKGPEITAEVNDANAAIKALGGMLSDIKTVEIPLGNLKRTIVVIKKVRQTPTKYPRTAAEITKKPIK
jgi:16S rRNA (guanine527-N7)-methyltransferase